VLAVVGALAAGLIALALLILILHLVHVGSAGSLTVITYLVLIILVPTILAGLRASLELTSLLGPSGRVDSVFGAVSVVAVLILGMHFLSGTPTPGLPLSNFLPRMNACGGRLAASQRPQILLVIDPNARPEQDMMAAIRREPGILAATPSRTCRSRFAVALAVKAGSALPTLQVIQPFTDSRRRVAAAILQSDKTLDALPPWLAASLSPGIFRGGIAKAGGGDDLGKRAIVFLVERLPKTVASNGALALRLLSRNAKSLETPAYVAVLNRPDPASLKAWSGFLRVHDPTLLLADTQGPGLLFPGEYDRTTNPLDLIEDAIREPTAREDADIAFAHRPVLFADSGETRVPLDIDALLAEKDAAGHSVHSICKVFFGYTSCARLHSAMELAVSNAAYLNVRSQPRAVARRGSDSQIPQRIYYGIRRTGERVAIDYWWFYRYNDSPVARFWMCIGGVSIADATCFDHQGDWEGVTVALSKGQISATPTTVSYTGHHWSYRYNWHTLRGFGAVAGIRPVVFVARDSHASYPVRCVRHRGACDQLDFRLHSFRLPDGSADGRQPWRLNGDNSCRVARCLQPLPRHSNGSPDSWNAFMGLWGAPLCTLGGDFICTRGKGPRSPSLQERKESELGSRDELVRRAKAFG
jgi:hypothetical protein